MGDGTVNAELFRAQKALGEVQRERAITQATVLRQEGFSPRTSDTGGTQGRKVRFYSVTGEVFVKRIRMEADS